MQNYTLFPQANTHTIYTVLFTLQADLADEVCAHVDLRQISQQQDAATKSHSQKWW